MFELPLKELRSLSKIGLSAAAHALVLLALVHVFREARLRAFKPGTSGGSRIELTYLPGGGPSAAPHMIRGRAPAPRREGKLSLPTKPQTAPAAAAARSATAPASSAANDALGSDNIQIAFTTYSPSPKPDLSRLPRGTQGEVVLDVTIDPTGQVADLQILGTLGYGVEDAVSQTVRTWRFTPATRDGVPIASVQELHFHYGPV